MVLTINMIFFVLGFPSESLPFTFFGVIFGWIYLRFFQVRDGAVGDRSEAFSFASFFPEPLQ
jgi:hypothetical protein